MRFKSIWGYSVRYLRLGIVSLGIALLASTSDLPLNDKLDQIRVYTRSIEFDFVGWTLDVLNLKVLDFALGTTHYMPAPARRQVMVEYLEVVRKIHELEWQVNLLYADPNVKDPQAASAGLLVQLRGLSARHEQLAPLAETILQSQISYVVDQMGLDLGGQPVPPVLYHSTALPLVLIISPRDAIRQEYGIGLIPYISTEDKFELESRVDRAANVSSLVENIGGMGLYPTMVAQTSDLPWLSEVVAHEWVHNFMTLRPLGMNYATSPELRVMNETTASLAGKEIGRAVLQIFYPEFLPPPLPPPSPPPQRQPEPPPAFDFRHEMHQTRLTVDQLLAEGKIEEAETYMEERRKVFWENDYRGLRKLNQAYFAFHGAYADEPGGAAGATEDPVGAAVRTLRARSPSLAAFLNRISWMFSFEQLEAAVNKS